MLELGLIGELRRLRAKNKVTAFDCLADGVGEEIIRQLKEKLTAS